LASSGFSPSLDSAKRARVSSPPSFERVRVGIDENGLGPRLGPLVVTAVLARTDERGAARLGQRQRGALKERLGDSKKLVAFGDSALGEAWARAIARRAGIEVATPDELVHRLSLDSSETLKTPCPGEHVHQCWGAKDDTFLSDDAAVTVAERDLDRLERAGVSVLGAKTAIVCTNALNAAAERGKSRFDVDLHTSLVGKWVRDALMGKILRHYQADDPSLPMASGYHDPVTTRFIDATSLTRKRRDVPDRCFERVRVSRDLD
jgi:ribonuclease HII